MRSERSQPRKMAMSREAPRGVERHAVKQKALAVALWRSIVCESDGGHVFEGAGIELSQAMGFQFARVWHEKQLSTLADESAGAFRKFAIEANQQANGDAAGWRIEFANGQILTGYEKTFGLVKTAGMHFCVV